ncbi:MAG: glycosyltransferase [Candidatus Omnitrophica bacterium]|nr:glycosyltransferase [Candidatus Omnitrophota bacterium]
MNKITPLITTIIPTFRRPTLLRRAIKSALNQTYPHFQVYVYDNASGDQTQEIVAEIAKNDHRVKYYCHPENIGVLPNFNYGMEHVETPFFSFLSDDDILLPEFYQTAVESFQSHPGAAFLVTATLFRDNKCNIWDSFGLKWISGLYQPPEGLLAILKNGPPAWTGIVFCKRIIERIGMLDTEVGAAIDLDFMLRAAAHFPFVVSLKPGAVFLFHASSTSRRGDFSFIWPGWLKMVRNLEGNRHLSPEVRSQAVQMLTKRLKKSLYYVGYKSISCRNFEDVYKISGVLRNNCHLNIMGSFFSVIAKIGNCLPKTFNFDILMKVIRKVSLTKRSLCLRRSKIAPSIFRYVRELENEA